MFRQIPTQAVRCENRPINAKREKPTGLAQDRVVYMNSVLTRIEHPGNVVVCNCKNSVPRLAQLV